MSKVKDRAYKKTMNYLTFTLGYQHKVANKIIRRYGNEILKEAKPPNDTTQIYYVEICKHIQANWQSFMDFYGTIKTIYPRHFHKHNYRSWWNECNLNGSFAYNGVTDDF